MALPAYIDATTGAITDGEAWVGIAHETLSLPAATVTWISTDDGQVGDFSQYMDMKIICYAKGTTASINGNLNLRFNNDATANAYAHQKIRGNGSAITPQTGDENYWEVAELPGSADPPGADVFGAAVIDIFDINSGKYKSGIALGAAGDHTDTNSYISLYATTWKSQAPITEIDIYSRNLGNFVVGCQFSLFGILPRMVA